jgi:hypothetical protein
MVLGNPRLPKTVTLLEAEAFAPLRKWCSPPARGWRGRLDLAPEIKKPAYRTFEEAGAIGLAMVHEYARPHPTEADPAECMVMAVVPIDDGRGKVHGAVPYLSCEPELRTLASAAAKLRELHEKDRLARVRLGRRFFAPKVPASVHADPDPYISPQGTHFPRWLEEPERISKVTEDSGLRGRPEPCVYVSGDPAQAASMLFAIGRRGFLWSPQFGGTPSQRSRVESAREMLTAQARRGASGEEGEAIHAIWARLRTRAGLD